MLDDLTHWALVAAVGRWWGRAWRTFDDVSINYVQGLRTRLFTNAVREVRRTDLMVDRQLNEQFSERIRAAGRCGLRADTMKCRAMVVPFTEDLPYRRTRASRVEL